MEIKTETDIINLNNFWYSNNHIWFGKKHKTNNPRGYVLEPDFKDPLIKQKYRDIRLGHLNQLLELVYQNYMVYKDELQLTPVEIKRFNRYIYTEVIYNFPYKCFKDLKKEDFISSKSLTGYNSWIEDVLTYKTDSKTGNNKYTDDIDLLEKRRNVTLRYFVAEVAHFINKLQVDDLKLDNNESEELVYGKKHALSAFLGQHIIRMFPFKEGIKFRSQSVFDVNPKDVVYEHWTPISFFRDLIWIEQPDSGKPKLYTPEEWFTILKYSYRTVLVSKEEDSKLNQNKFKSKRPFSAYDKLGIKVNEGEKALWDRLHKI